MELHTTDEMILALDANRNGVVWSDDPETHHWLEELRDVRQVFTIRNGFAIKRGDSKLVTFGSMFKSLHNSILISFEDLMMKKRSKRLYSIFKQKMFTARKFRS